MEYAQTVSPVESGDDNNENFSDGENAAGR
jgi:hypothetical protein